MEFPSELVKNAVEQLSTLPGIGKRSALRLTLHLLKKNKDQVEKFGNSFIDLINNINYCKECFTISDFDVRPNSTILVEKFIALSELTTSESKLAKSFSQEVKIKAISNIFKKLNFILL